MGIEYVGATYHVICRGDRREAIFADAADQFMFLATLAEAIAKTGWRLHGYMLMSNHYISCSKRRKPIWCGAWPGLRRPPPPWRCLGSLGSNHLHDSL